MYRVSCRLCCIEIGIDSQFIATITIFVISPRTVAQHLGQQPCRFTIESKKKKKKVKEADLYSAFIEVPYTQGAQVQITQCYLQITPYLPLFC